METIGLLTAWVGVVSFLIIALVMAASNVIRTPLARCGAKLSPNRRQRRIEKLLFHIEASEDPGKVLFDLVALFGWATITLTAALGVLLFSIQLLDLGPSLLAANLPFRINNKWLTQGTGVSLFLAAYILLFRLCYLGVQIQDLLQIRNRRYIRRAVTEVEQLRNLIPAPHQATITARSRSVL